MIYHPAIEYTAADYITTSTGNIISRSAELRKPQCVEIPQGRCIIGPQALIRGDLAPVQLNRYCVVGARSVLQPCSTTTTINGVETVKYIPQTIGTEVNIGEDCLIEAAVIGTGCTIGNNCVLSKRCILKDYVNVLGGSVVPPDMVIPPFCIVSGNPAQIVGEMPESTSTLSNRAAVERYKAYVLKG
jgi:dynactin-5